MKTSKHSMGGYRGSVDILTGGFPCQPFSKTGRRKGKDDDRYLWPEMLRVIKETGPGWVVGENVPGIQTMELDVVLSSLEDAGYKTEVFIIPASAVGAWHQRERVWIVAHSNSHGQKRNEFKKGCDSNQKRPVVAEDIKSANINSESMEGHSRYEYSSEIWKEEIGRNGQSYWSFPWPEVASGFCRNNDGIPNRVDRIKALGNAIVPQVAYEIFKMIEHVDTYKILHSKAHKRVKRGEAEDSCDEHR